MGYLKHNADTITGLAFGILSCTVFKILHNAECVLNRLVSLDSLDINDCTDTTVIMFKLWIIQSVVVCVIVNHSSLSFPKIDYL